MKYTELYVQFLENLVETKSCELRDTQSKLDDASMSVNHLFDAVDKKNSEIARLNDEFNALAKEKHSIEVERGRLDNSIENLMACIDKKDSKLSELKTVVETLRKCMDNKDDHIAEMENTISAQNKRLLAFEDIIDAKNQELQRVQNEENTKVLEVQQIELERQRLANECYQLKVANGNFLKVIETQDKNRILLEERIKDLESIVANKDAAIEDSINKRLKVIIQLDKAEELLKDLDVEIRRDPEGIKPTEYIYGPYMPLY